MICSGANLGLSSGGCAGKYTEGGALTLDRLFNDPKKGATATVSAMAADAMSVEDMLRLLAYAQAPPLNHHTVLAVRSSSPLSTATCRHPSPPIGPHMAATA